MSSVPPVYDSSGICRFRTSVTVEKKLFSAGLFVVFECALFFCSLDEGDLRKAVMKRVGWDSPLFLMRWIGESREVGGREVRNFEGS